MGEDAVKNDIRVHPGDVLVNHSPWDESAYVAVRIVLSDELHMSISNTGRVTLAAPPYLGDTDDNTWPSKVWAKL